MEQFDNFNNFSIDKSPWIISISLISYLSLIYE